MPKVRTETRGVGGRIHTFVYSVRASGVFSCPLPPEVAVCVGHSVVEAPTLDACVKALENALDTFVKSNSNTRKVILYSMACNAHIVRDGKVVFSSGRTGVRAGPRCEAVAFADGCALDVWAMVAEETCFRRPDGSCLYSYHEVKSGIPPSAEGHKRLPGSQTTPVSGLLPWTQEREAFFVRVVQGLEAVILSLVALNDPDKALAFVDQTPQLPSTASGNQ